MRAYPAGPGRGWSGRIPACGVFLGMDITLDGKVFQGVSNAANGQVSGATRFYYAQSGHLVRARYSGGEIAEGHMLGTMRDDGSMLLVYHHLDIAGELRSGICESRPERLPDGRVRIREDWRWTYGGEGAGQSVVEEVQPS